MNALSKAWQAFIDFIEGPVWKFIHPFVTALEAGAGQILINAAETAVQAGFAATGSGEDKMKAALASFASEIADHGVPFAEAQARALIELALQKAKAAAPVDTTPAA